MKANSKYDEFQWRYITIDDYEGLLTDWWDAWKFPRPTLDMLPKDGIIISKDGVDLYAGFIYYTGTSVAWVEYIVANKEAPRELRSGGLDRLIDIISTIVKTKGVNKLITSTVSESFVNSLVKCGFGVGDTNLTQLLKII